MGKVNAMFLFLHLFLLSSLNSFYSLHVCLCGSFCSL